MSMMATNQIDASTGFASLTQYQFKRLNKEQLMALAEVEDVDLEKGMKKQAIIACLVEVLDLETRWERERAAGEKESSRRERAAGESDSSEGRRQSA